MCIDVFKYWLETVIRNLFMWGFKKDFTLVAKTFKKLKSFVVYAQKTTNMQTIC